jgi:predicted nucleic acid-binding protein
MMPERLVLDTNIVIDLLKKSPAVVERFLALLEAQTTMLISPIVVAEVYAGAFKREHKDVEALFDLCQRVDMDSDIGRMAGLYANQYAKAFQGIALEDYLLAATARAHRCPLWTLNRKHYPMDDVTLF